MTKNTPRANSSLSAIIVVINCTSPPSHQSSLLLPPKLSVLLGAFPKFFHFRSLPFFASCSLAWNGGLQSVKWYKSFWFITPLNILAGFFCSLTVIFKALNCAICLAILTEIGSISEPVKCQLYSLVPVNGKT